MRRFVLGWKQLGHEKRLKASIVNYADDLVICCRGNAEEALATMREHDGEAEVDGERDQDAGLQAAGREVRFSGLYVWALLLAADGAGLSGHHAVQEAGTRICAAISSETGRGKTLLDARDGGSKA